MTSKGEFKRHLYRDHGPKKVPPYWSTMKQLEDWHDADHQRGYTNHDHDRSGRVIPKP